MAAGQSEGPASGARRLRRFRPRASRSILLKKAYVFFARCSGSVSIHGTDGAMLLRARK